MEQCEKAARKQTVQIEDQLDGALFFKSSLWGSFASPQPRRAEGVAVHDIHVECKKFCDSGGWEGVTKQRKCEGANPAHPPLSQM